MQGTQRGSKWARAGIAAALLTLSVGAPAMAQKASLTGKSVVVKKGPVGAPLVTVDFRNRTLMEAIQLVMDAAGANYVLNVDLPNPHLTLRMKQVRLPAVLDALIKASKQPFSYRMENGIFYLVPNPKEVPEEKIPEEAGTQPVELEPLKRRVSLKVKGENVFDLLKRIMSVQKLNYAIAPELRQINVTADLSNVPLGKALEVLGKASEKPFTYRVENEVFSFFLTETAPQQ